MLSIEEQGAIMMPQLIIKHAKKHHHSTVMRSTVVRVTSHFNGRLQNLTALYIPNPLIFPHQNMHRWLCLAYLPMCSSQPLQKNLWNIKHKKTT